MKREGAAAEEYRLTCGEELLGILRPYGGDFPWVFCKFEPAEAFGRHRALFDEFARLADGDDHEAQDECFARLEALGLRLESNEGARDFGEFYIVVRGDEASVR